jgi:hypothetical protein
MSYLSRDIGLIINRSKFGELRDHRFFYTLNQIDIIEIPQETIQLLSPFRFPDTDSLATENFCLYSYDPISKKSSETRNYGLGKISSLEEALITNDINRTLFLLENYTRINFMTGKINSNDYQRVRELLIINGYEDDKVLNDLQFFDSIIEKLEKKVIDSKINYGGSHIAFAISTKVKLNLIQQKKMTRKILKKIAHCICIDFIHCHNVRNNDGFKDIFETFKGVYQKIIKLRKMKKFEKDYDYLDQIINSFAFLLKK